MITRRLEIVKGRRWRCLYHLLFPARQVIRCFFITKSPQPPSFLKPAASAATTPPLNLLKPLNPHTEGMPKGEAATTTSELSEPGPQSGPYSRPLPTRCARHPPPERGWAGKKEERDALFKICGVSRHHNPRPERPSNLRTLRPSGRSILRTFSIPVDTILRG